MAVKSTKNNSGDTKLLFGISSGLIFLAIVFIATTTYLWTKNNNLDKKVDQTLIFVVEIIWDEKLFSAFLYEITTDFRRWLNELLYQLLSQLGSLKPTV